MKDEPTVFVTRRARRANRRAPKDGFVLRMRFDDAADGEPRYVTFGSPDGTRWPAFAYFTRSESNEPEDDAERDGLPGKSLADS